VRTPANAVTTVRILLTPVVIVVIYRYAPAWWVLAIGFVSMMTDHLDGYLARRYGTSEFGAFLDPLADKLMVLGSLYALVALGWVWWLPVTLIAVREVAMSSWRSRLARNGVSVPARKSAKYKTWTQSFAVAAALVPGIVSNHRWIVTSIVWLAVAFTLLTFLQYVRDARSGRPIGDERAAPATVDSALGDRATGEPAQP